MTAALLGLAAWAVLLILSSIQLATELRWRHRQRVRDASRTTQPAAKETQ